MISDDKQSTYGMLLAALNYNSAHHMFSNTKMHYVLQMRVWAPIDLLFKYLTHFYHKPCVLFRFSLKLNNQFSHFADQHQFNGDDIGIAKR